MERVSDADNADREEKAVRSLLAGLITVALLLQVAVPVRALNVYRLSVDVGSKASYVIVDAYNVSIGDYYLKAGDRLDYKVTDIIEVNITYTNGSVAFAVEMPLCTVMLNGNLIMVNDTPQKLGLYSPYAPSGVNYWQSQKLILEDLREKYKEGGSDLYYSLSFKEGQARLYIELSGRRGTIEERLIVDLETGLLLKFERTIYGTEGRAVKVFKGIYVEPPSGSGSSETTITTVSEPLGGSQLWLMVLIAMVAIVIAGGILTRGKR